MGRLIFIYFLQKELHRVRQWCVESKSEGIDKSQIYGYYININLNANDLQQLLRSEEILKKIISVILSACIISTLVGCSKSTIAQKEDNQVNQSKIQVVVAFNPLKQFAEAGANIITFHLESRSKNHYTRRRWTTWLWTKNKRYGRY